MIGAKGKTYKAVEGIPCVKGQAYLVIWKMSGLPSAGDTSDVSYHIGYLMQNKLNILLKRF